MLFGFTLKQMFGYDSEKSVNYLSEKFVDFVHGLMSLPLNVPGTTYHKCLKVTIKHKQSPRFGRTRSFLIIFFYLIQDQKEVLNMMREIVKERLTFPEKY